APAPPELSPLSLHDALPIFAVPGSGREVGIAAHRVPEPGRVGDGPGVQAPKRVTALHRLHHLTLGPPGADECCHGAGRSGRGVGAPADRIVHHFRFRKTSSLWTRRPMARVRSAPRYPSAVTRTTCTRHSSSNLGLNSSR